MLADVAEVGQVPGGFDEEGAQGCGIFLDCEAVPAGGDALSGAAALDEDAGQTAGGRLTDHQAVGVEGGGEDEEVRAGVPGSEDVAVVDCPGENALAGDIVVVHEAVLAGFIFHELLVGALADEDHAEVLAGVGEDLEGVQDHGDALVGHHAADEEEHGYIFRQVVAGGGCFDGGPVHPAFLEVHAVVHDVPLALEAQGGEALAGAAAHDPDVVAGGNVADHGLDGLLSSRLYLDDAAKVDVILGVVSKDDGRLHFVPEEPRDDGGGSGAVGMDDVRLEGCHLRDGFSREGVARPVAAGQALGAEALVGDDRVGVGGVVRVRVARGADDDRAAKIRGQVFGVIDDHVGDAVQDRREGIVQETDFHGDLRKTSLVLLFYTHFEENETTG